MEDKEQEDQYQPRRLGWIDIVITFVGIVTLFLSLGLATGWIASWWPHEKLLLYVNGFLTQLLFVVILLFLNHFRGWSWADYGWRKNDLQPFGGSVIKIYGLTWVANLFYGVFLVRQGITPPDNDVYAKLLGQPTMVTLILNFILAGLLAPMIEETLFRGVIYQGLQTYFGKGTSMFLSALFFSGLHLQVYGLFPRFVLGMALAYLFDKYHSVYPSIALHSLNNVVALTLVALSSG